MRKIPSVFRRLDAERDKDSLIVDEVMPGCEWMNARKS